MSGEKNPNLISRIRFGLELLLKVLMHTFYHREKSVFLKGPKIALRLLVLAAFPLLLSALAALWAYYRFRHPWRSAGVSVGYEPDDGWASKEGGELEHFFLLG